MSMLPWKCPLECPYAKSAPPASAEPVAWEPTHRCKIQKAYRCFACEKETEDALAELLSAIAEVTITNCTARFAAASKNARCIVAKWSDE